MRHGISLALVTLLVLCGCTATPGTTPATTTPTPVEDGTATTDRGDDPPLHPSYDAYVFDHGGFETPVIEGGLTHDGGEYGTQYYVTTVSSRSDIHERFNMVILDADARSYIEKTSFVNASLVVIQHFPASSVPDYRVESVERSDDALHVRINDSSEIATTDITVETVLLRVSGDPPAQVTVTTEEGHTFDSSDGVVTMTPEPTPTPDPSRILPYASPNESANVETPRGIRLVNEENDTVGYELTVTYHERPACRDETPPCGQPARSIEVLERLDKLPPGQSVELRDLVTRRGNYTVEVTATDPGEDGQNATVTASIDWLIDENARNLVVAFDAGDLTVTRPSP